MPDRPCSATAATAAPGRRSAFVVLIVLGGLVALGPLSTDAYVPGLPRLAADLGSSTSLAQVTITSCLVGLAAGQLLAGPLSDVYGRRVPLLFGITPYTVAGLLCAAAPNVLTLIALRGVQGIGGACALVIAYACVRDRDSGPAAARYFAALLLVTGLAPVLAPLGGGQILAIWSWRGVFVVLAALSALLLFAVAVALPESLHPARRSAGGLRVAGLTYRRLLADRQLVGYDLVQLALFRDYGTNPPLYPALHDCLRSSAVPLLAVWGEGDEIFGPDGARAFATDAVDPEIHLLPGGHFLLESATEEVAGLVRDFLVRRLPAGL